MKLTKAQRATLHAMFGGHCAYCGCILGDRWHADHFEHVERKLKRLPDGRTVSTAEMHRPERDTVANLMPACAPCNIDKHNLSLDEWRTKLQNAAGVLARNQPTYRHAVRFGLAQETGAKVTFHFERLAAAAPAARTAAPLNQGTP